MHTSSLKIRALTWAFIASLTVLSSDKARASDVTSYYVAKAQKFTQTNASTPVLTSGSPYSLVSKVFPSAPNVVSAATLQAPNNVFKNLTNDGFRFRFVDAFTNKSTLDATYTSGTYTLSVSAVNDGAKSLPLTLPGDNYPTTPHISNFPAAQVINASGVFRLTWDSFVGGVTSDHIKVEIDGANGQPIFITPDILQAGSLNGTATFVDIPANTLAPGTTYTARLLFWKITSFDTTSYPSVTGGTAYYNQTDFAVATAGNPPVITSAATATGTAGQSFSYTITANNSATSFGASGLPAGLSVSTATGVISGIPAAASTNSVTLSASNAVGNGTMTLTLAVLPSSPVITSAATATATVGQSFSYTITANNNPTGFGATGLPAGLSVNGMTGLISGTPTTAGTFNATLSATNAGGTGTASLPLTVNLPPPPSITAQPQGQTLNVGASVTFSVTATGSAPLSYQWQKDGTNLATATGTSYAIASVQTNHAGSYTVVVSNFGGSVTSSPALLIVNRLSQTITFGALSAKQFGNAPFALTATSSSGLPISYSSSLPSVATVSGSTVTLVAAGTTSITASQPGDATYLPAASVSQSLLVNPATPVITSAGTASAIISQSFTYQITASGSPTSFTALNLPAGLSVNTASGLISGTPTQLVTNAVALSASNAGGTGSASVTIAVNPAPPSITIQPRSHTVTNSGFGFNYSGLWVAANGTAPLFYQWRLNGTNLPGETFTNVSFTLQVGQAANYSVVVSNIAGSITSSVARVVLVPPPFSSGLSGWGLNDSNQITLPNGLSNLVSVVAFAARNLGLKDDGTVVAWGANVNNSAPPPGGLSNVIALAAGYTHSLALKEDGTLVGWGSQAVPAGLSNVLAIAAGADHCMALRSDGTVAVWGLVYVFSNGTLVSTSPAPSPPAGLSNVVAIAAGWHHCLALRADGTVVGWGENDFGQATPPAGLSNVVAITGNMAHSLALRGDGVVVGWGQDGAFGKATPPVTLTNAIAIAAGSEHSLALRSDGTVVGWGNNGVGEISIPSGLSNVVQIAAGFNHSLALTGSKPGPRFTAVSVSTNNALRLTAASFIRQSYVTESSTDFLTWLPVATNQPIGSFVLATDPTPVGQSRRFYRLLAP